MKRYFIVVFLIVGFLSVGMAKKEKIDISFNNTNYTDIYKYYEDAKKDGKNLFITMDVPLYTMHFIYDNSLIRVEENYLYKYFEKFLYRLDTIVKGYTNNIEYLPSLAYVEVMIKLLNPDFTSDRRVRRIVESEIEKIDRHIGFEESSIFKDVKEDYSQYVPRGHYTKSEKLKRYFKAMMFAGRYPFFIDDDYKMLSKNALFLSTIIREDSVLRDLWFNINEIVLYFVGPPDDLTPKEIYYIAQKVYGKKYDVNKIDIVPFIKECKKWRKSKIVSHYMEDTRKDKDRKNTIFKLFGQKFIVDSYVFQNLVYDKVTDFTGKGKPFTLSGRVRGFPMGLDLMAVLGSDLAVKYLKNHEETSYRGYNDQFEKMKEFVNKKPVYDNLYSDYIDLLKIIVLLPNNDDLPSFMKSEMWYNRTLISSLVYWALLRHDTILYAKQSYTLKATAVRPPVRKTEPDVYLEPSYPVYRKLAEIAHKMANNLELHGVKDRELTDNMIEFERFMKMYSAVSLKEMKGEKLSDKEKKDIIYTVGAMKDIIKRIGTIPSDDKILKPDMDTRSVADVHTDVNSGMVLEEGTGNLMEVVLTKKNKKYYGVIPTYYEFKANMNNRLTDEEWREMKKDDYMPWWERRFFENNRR